MIFDIERVGRLTFVYHSNLDKMRIDNNVELNRFCLGCLYKYLSVTVYC